MSVGRFAGAEMNKFMGSGVKFGEMAQTERSMNSQMNAQTSLADSAVAGTSLTTSADVQANKLISEAQAKLGSAQSQASGMSGMMSGIAGGIGNMSFGGGGGGGFGGTPLTGGTPGVSPSGLSYFG